MTTLQWPNGPKCLMMQHWKTVAQQWRGDDGGGDAICRNFPLAPLIICRPLHKADKFHTKSYLAKHDLTFCAQSCTVDQMEIFAQEFEPASYFCDWTCVHLIMR